MWVSLCISLLLIKLIQKCDFKEIICIIRNFVLTGISGCTLYYIVLKIILYKRGLELTSYQGANQISFSLKNIWEAIFKSYKEFFSFFSSSVLLRSNRIETIVILAICLIGLLTYFFMAYRNKIESWKWISSIILWMVFPCGIYFMYFIMPDVMYHMLMKMGWSILFVTFIVIVDKLHSVEEKIYKSAVSVNWIFTISCALLIFNFILIDNIAYFNMHQRYEKEYALCVRLADRIEQTDGYHTGMTVYMYGRIEENSRYYSPTSLTTDKTDELIGTSGDFTLLYTTSLYQSFLKNYLGISLELDWDMKEPDELKAMPVWPEENSVQVINDTLLIKLSPWSEN